MSHKSKKRRLRRLEKGRPGVFDPWGGAEPDTWFDEAGCRWLLDDLGTPILSPQQVRDSLAALAEKGLIERRTFTIKGRQREGVRIRETALALQLAMLEE